MGQLGSEVWLWVRIGLADKAVQGSYDISHVH